MKRETSDLQRVGSFNYLARSVQSSLHRNGAVRLRRDRDGSDSDVVGVAIRPPDDPRAVKLSADVASLGRRYEEAIEVMWRQMRWVVSPKRLARWADLLLEHVPWQQREAAMQYFAGKLDVEGLWERAFANQKAQYLRTLDQNPILAELNDEEKEAIAGVLSHEQYGDGERIGAGRRLR